MTEGLNPPEPQVQAVEPAKPTLEERVDVLEAALAASVGHSIAGARKGADGKSPGSHAMTWFETVRAKYYPTSPPK